MLVRLKREFPTGVATNTPHFSSFPVHRPVSVRQPMSEWSPSCRRVRSWPMPSKVPSWARVEAMRVRAVRKRDRIVEYWYGDVGNWGGLRWVEVEIRGELG